MRARPSVIVLGAGIVGASIAWHLTQAGADVTIVAEEPQGVATPASFAWINASWGNPEFYVRFRLQAMADWHRLSQALPGLPLSWCGGLCYDLAPDELDRFEAQHRAWGYDLVRLDRDAIAAREPYLAAPPATALLAAAEGMVEPAAAARLLLADAVAAGARHVTATVSGLLSTGGRIAGLVTSAGVFDGDRLVLAAGAGTGPLAASIGIDLPLLAPPGLIVHSRPFAKRLNGLVLAPELHMRQTADGRIVAGGDFGGSDPGEDPREEARRLFQRLAGMIRDSEALALDYFTLGYRPQPKDGFPILGPASPDGPYLAVMHSGVTLAPLVGRLVAEDLLSGGEAAALAPFRLARFV